MDKSKLLKLFIILFKHEMFNYLKEPFYLLGEGLIVLKLCCIIICSISTKTNTVLFPCYKV